MSWEANDVRWFGHDPLGFGYFAARAQSNGPLADAVQGKPGAVVEVRSKVQENEPPSTREWQLEGSPFVGGNFHHSIAGPIFGVLINYFFFFFFFFFFCLETSVVATVIIV